jgi:hypothetical protein
MASQLVSGNGISGGTVAPERGVPDRLPKGPIHSEFIVQV